MDNSKFIWFMGIVEDVNDPKKLGRVKVRMINEYSDRVDLDDIPWALPMMPVNSASYLGIGTSPTGLQKGSRVIGFFMDSEDKTKPIIMGSHPIILNGNESDHSVAQQARGNGPIKKDYLDYEPQTQYASEYPNNNTISTKSGHMIEIDDTPKAERIHIYHKGGSYIEMNPDGSIIIKSNEKSYDISMKEKFIVSEKDIGIESKNENIEILAKKDSGLYGEENVNIGAGEKLDVKSNDIFISADGNIEIAAKNITIKSNVKIEGELIVTDEVTSNGIKLTKHKHTGVDKGSSTSGGPTS